MIDKRLIKKQNKHNLTKRKTKYKEKEQRYIPQNFNFGYRKFNNEKTLLDGNDIENQDDFEAWQYFCQ